MKLWLTLFLALQFAVSAYAAEAVPLAEDPAVEQRMIAITEELRCLVCQNESLAESRAPLALDLKYEVRSLVAQGKSATEIKHYLTDRYGDFVLFRPPFDPRTWLLWIGPFALVLLGLLVLVRQIRSTRRAAVRAATTAKPADPAALKKLLDE